MAKRRRQERLEPSRKEQAMSRRDREEARRLTIIVGGALAVAALVLIGGLAYQFLIVPNSAVAAVNGENISTRQFWDQSKFQQYQTIGQLTNLIQFEQQLDPTGEQGFFTSQIQQLQATLSDSEGLANQVLEAMIDQAVVQQSAAEAGISVSEDEYQAELQSVIAGQLGSVTEPEATATAEALAAATATPTVTPSPTPEEAPAEDTTPTPTLEPQPTATVHVMTQDEFTTGYQDLIDNVSQAADISKTSTENIYRKLITADLLRTKLTDQLGDQMPTSGEQVRARHILISVAEDATDAEEQAALAKAISITNQLKDGADFATLAEKYSDDTSSAANGGDLGFFGRGQMVSEFEDAAFSLPVGEISDPVRSQFGYHIIQVEERNPGQPDFSAWLQEKKAAGNIERRLTDARLPELPPVDPNLLAYSAAPAAVPTVVQPLPTATGQ
jgi:parvulin-like peptidyl-prolyl isomerase